MNILFTGAHTDDIEHGAGGIFCYLLKQKQHRVKYISFSLCTDLERNNGIIEDQKLIKQFIVDNNGFVTMHDFPNKMLFTTSSAIRDILENEKIIFKPDIIFTHWLNDVHQDHKVIAEESLRVFRKHSVLSYDCPNTCFDFVSNYFFPLTEQQVNDKIELLHLYKTQKKLNYLTKDVIWSLAKTRGTSIDCSFAESFYINKLIGFLCAL